MSRVPEPSLTRRTLLGAIGGAGTAALAGCGMFQRSEDAGTSQVSDERARELATQFAPTLFFDRYEQWFPTDPRPFATEQDGETVVQGFDALDGYHERFAPDDPPNPTAFYNVVEYDDSPLAVVQYWMYSTFDQFTTNFHWHDWEVLHVFVDTETTDPQLYVASSHSRSVPNNEFLDPEPGVVPRILSELGSHSSALSVNDVPEHFQRLSADGLLADITNSTIDGIEDLAAIPLAYGLPRDERWRLPYSVPEYEGAPLWEHDDLPSVTQESLIDDVLTVRSLTSLESPPTELPTRETGLRFQHRERSGDAEVEYELVPSAELEHISDFTGPQLSFEFTIPSPVEDQFASHLTTTGVPWDQPRYRNPAADVSDPDHRLALADRYDAIGEPAPINMVVAEVTEAVSSADAPDDEGLTTTATPVESFAFLQSEPTAVPTSNGIAVVRDVPTGSHRLTVNGAGRAPHSEQVDVAGEGETTPAGVGGEIPLVARKRARKLEVLGDDGSTDLDAVAVEDDFAGRLYASPVTENDAIYLHDGGAYTTEVRDAADEVGAYRVNPDPAETAPVRIEQPETGTAPLAAYVADVAAETAILVAEQGAQSDSGGASNAVSGLVRALENVAEAARSAADHARAGDRSAADRQLETVTQRLQTVGDRLAAARADMVAPVSNATENRLSQATLRAEQAGQADSLGGRPAD